MSQIDWEQKCRASRAKARETVARLKKVLEKERRNKQDLQDRITELEKAGHNEEETDNLRAEIEKLQAKLQRQADGSMAETVSMWKDMFNQLQLEFVKKSEELELANQRAKPDNELKKTIREMNEKQIQADLVEFDDRQSEIDFLVAESEKQVIIIEELSQSLTEKTNLQTKNDQKLSAMSDMIKSYEKKLLKQAKELSDEPKKWASLIDLSKEEIEELRKSNDKLSKSNDNLTADNLKWGEYLTNAKQEIDELKELTANLENEIEYNQKQRDSVHHEYMVLQDTYLELQAKYQILEKEKKMQSGSAIPAEEPTKEPAKEENFVSMDEFMKFRKLTENLSLQLDSMKSQSPVIPHNSEVDSRLQNLENDVKKIKELIDAAEFSDFPLDLFEDPKEDPKTSLQEAFPLAAQFFKTQEITLEYEEIETNSPPPEKYNNVIRKIEEFSKQLEIREPKLEMEIPLASKNFPIGDEYNHVAENLGGAECADQNVENENHNHAENGFDFGLDFVEPENKIAEIELENNHAENGFDLDFIEPENNHAEIVENNHEPQKGLDLDFIESENQNQKHIIEKSKPEEISDFADLDFTDDFGADEEFFDSFI